MSLVARIVVPLLQSVRRPDSWSAAWTPWTGGCGVGVQNSTVFTLSIGMHCIVRLIGAPVGEVGPLAVRPNPIAFLRYIIESNPRSYFYHVEADSFIVKLLILFLCLNLDEMSVQVLTGVLGIGPVGRPSEEEVAAMREGGPRISAAVWTGIDCTIPGHLDFEVFASEDPII